MLEKFIREYTMMRIETKQWINVDFCRSQIVNITLQPGDKVDGRELPNGAVISITPSASEKLQPVSINDIIYGLVKYEENQL